MMKRIFGIIALNLLFFAVGYAQEKDERDVGSFERIRVSQGIEVELVKGNDENITISAIGIDIDRVVTEVKGSTLRIFLDGSKFSRNHEVNVIVVYRELNGISARSTAQVYSKSPIKADDFSIDVESLGSVDLEIEANFIEVEAVSASSVILSGKTRELKLEVHSASNFRAYELTAEVAYVRVSQAASARVTVSKKIDARASSAGSIRYRGNPDKEYTSSSSAGSVRRSN